MIIDQFNNGLSLLQRDTKKPDPRLVKEIFYGKRLHRAPVIGMTLPELAQLYAYRVWEFGENSVRCLEVIEELERRDRAVLEAEQERLVTWQGD